MEALNNIHIGPLDKKQEQHVRELLEQYTNVKWSSGDNPTELSFGRGILTIRDGDLLSGADGNLERVNYDQFLNIIKKQPMLKNIATQAETREQVEKIAELASMAGIECHHNTLVSRWEEGKYTEIGKNSDIYFAVRHISKLDADTIVIPYNEFISRLKKAAGIKETDGETVQLKKENLKEAYENGSPDVKKFIEDACPEVVESKKWCLQKEDHGSETIFQAKDKETGRTICTLYTVKNYGEIVLGLDAKLILSSKGYNPYQNGHTYNSNGTVKILIY